jgi:hypothetical protein
MSVKNSVTLDMKEIQHFGKLVLENRFYESFIDDFHRENIFDSNEKDFRTVVKDNILAMFNAELGKYKREEHIFSSKFPTIFQFIKEIKAEKGNHNYFAYLMFQIESYFMLHITARRLNNECRRKIHIFTLHDCLISTEDNLKKVYDFMTTTLTKELGFTPRLKQKVYKYSIKLK